MPGPESSSSSARTPPSAVVLKRVITSPAFRPAFSAGLPGVTASTRAPTLSAAASPRVSTMTPMRPREPLNAYAPNGPSTRTRGRARARGCGASCVTDAAGQINEAANAAMVKLRIISFPQGCLEPDVTSPRRASSHQLPHQPDPLLPKLDEFGVPLIRVAMRERGEGAVEIRNAILELGDHGRGVTGQHAAVEVVLLQ